MKKFALAIFLALTLVSAVVLAEKDYFPIAQQALWDAQKTPISDKTSHIFDKSPLTAPGMIIGCTMLMWNKPSKDVMWSVVKFEFQAENGIIGLAHFGKLVIITVDRKGQTTRNECLIGDDLIFYGNRAPKVK